MKKLLLLFLLILAPIFAKEKLDADYNGGQELILIERMAIHPQDEIAFLKQQYPNNEQINIADLEKSRRKFIYPNSIPLGSIYWIEILGVKHGYFYVKDGSRLTKTNGLTYKLDPKKQYEPTLSGESHDTQLLYAGYISPNERLYIDKDTKEQFIKVLEPIMDEPFQKFVSPTILNTNPLGWFRIFYLAENIFYLRNPTNGQLEKREHQ